MPASRGLLVEKFKQVAPESGALGVAPAPAAQATAPGDIAAVPTEPEITLDEAPAAAPAATGPPKTVVIVNTAQELQAALRHSTQHIEIQSHLLMYDDTTYSALHPERTRDPAATDGWHWHLHPSLEFVINAHLQVPASVRSIRGNCAEPFEAAARTWPAAVGGLQQRGAQCLLLLNEDPIHSSHTTIFDFLSELPERPDELPLWLDSLYVASADPAAAAHAEVFAWVSRDLWMTNVTMHSRDDTPAQAIWTDDLTLVEDSEFIGFAPPPGQSVVTAVGADVQLSACDFTGSQVRSGQQGLVGSYINGTVGVEGLAVGDACCDHLYWNYSPANNENEAVEVPVFYTAGEPQEVGGAGAGATGRLLALQQAGFMQQSTFPQRRARVEAEALSATPVEFLEENFPIDGKPFAAQPGDRLSVALVASLSCAGALLLGALLLAAYLWRRHRSREPAPALAHASDKGIGPRVVSQGADGSLEVASARTLGTAPSSVPRKGSSKGFAASDDASTATDTGAPGSGGALQGGRSTVGSGDPISTLSVATTNRPTMPQADASSYKRKNYLEYQLDTMHGMHVLGGLRFLSGLDKRLSGGQAVVQIAEDVRTKQQYAVKFFLYPQAFQHEARLYEDPEQPLGRFLPECRAIAAPARGTGCADKHGNPLPPCIVMEKGEALDKWAARSDEGLDFVTGLQVLTHVAERLKDLHAAGYVHRDVKPPNIMWLPRKNRWTLIDFGCAARTGTFATAGFSVCFAPPELLAAFLGGQGGLQASEALDAWSVGVLALEMFSGRPVWDHKVIAKHQVIAQILWGQAPWEDPATAPRLLSKLGHFRSAILSLLDRDPLARPSMAQFQHACNNVLHDPRAPAPNAPIAPIAPPAQNTAVGTTTGFNTAHSNSLVS